ncbi:hypothetical protein BKM77_16485 [Pseudomonas syringae]|nr:hypothetical protein BKM77_16485 [Pseudomonas syringae]
MFPTLFIKKILLGFTCVQTNHFIPTFLTTLQQSTTWNIKLDIDETFRRTPLKISGTVSSDKGLPAASLNNFVTTLHLCQFIRRHPSPDTSHAYIINSLGFAKLQCGISRFFCTNRGAKKITEL